PPFGQVPPPAPRSAERPPEIPPPPKPAATPARAGDALTAIAFSPDGQFLASGTAAADIVLWDVSSGDVLARLRGHVGPVTAVAFALDGRLLATAGQDGKICLWENMT